MASSSCAHGRTFTAVEHRNKVELLEECASLLHMGEARVRQENSEADDAELGDLVTRQLITTIYGFWGMHEGLIDDELCKLCFALAATAFFEKKLGTMLSLMSQAVHIKAAVDLGLSSLIELAHGANQLTLGDSIAKTETNAGKIHFLAENLPCTCLNTLLHRAGDVPTEKCRACGKEETLAKLYVCGGCKLVRYCSRECQRAHRKEHKAACQKLQAEAKLPSSSK